MKDSADSVSGIHKRYTLTLFNPSSHYQSLIYSVGVAAAVTALAVFSYRLTDDFLTGIALIIPILLVTQVIDSRLIVNKEYSKALHMSLFGNLIFLITAASAVLAAYVLGRPEVAGTHLVIGMFLFVSFRIGIFTTILGVSLKKAWLICFIQPLPMLLVLMPPDGVESALTDPVTLGFGAAFIAIASVWSKMTDNAGRPGVESTHRLIQVYLSSQGKDNESIEEIIEDRSSTSTVKTHQIRLENDKDIDVRLVLPDIHPGPYHPIGGSNIPFRIYETLGSSAMVMHSISDHSLNIPSQMQVERYLDGLKTTSTIGHGVTCTEPVVVQINKARVTGLLFDKKPILFLSLSPHGMEDLPSYIKTEIEQFAQNRSFRDVLVVDCHNAMGGEISKEDSEDMLKAAKSCLDALITKESHSLEFGYANSSRLDLYTVDLANGGLGILCLKINGKKYFLGWADANNMENGVRERVVEEFERHGHRLLELFTSDTHFSQVRVRNKNGYYQFGIMSKPDEIASWYLRIARDAEANLSPGRFEMLQNISRIKIMGPKIFEDYKAAIDNSLRITKFFASGGFALFVASLFV